MCPSHPLPPAQELKSSCRAGQILELAQKPQADVVFFPMEIVCSEEFSTDVWEMWKKHLWCFDEVFLFKQ